MIKFKIFSSDLELQASDAHIREHPFTALVTVAGRLSDRVVGGTELIEGGPYRVMIPPMLLTRKISELEGKRIYANATLDSHKQPAVIGRIASAWLEAVEPNVVAARVSGVLFRDSNPLLVDQVISMARAGQMGVSYDLKDVSFEMHQPAGSDPKYIELTDFEWRGATTLKRDAAAYMLTQLAASKSTINDEEEAMDKNEIAAVVRDGMTQAFREFASTTVDPLKTELSASIASVKTELAELKGKQSTLEATVAGRKDETKPEDKKEPEKQQKEPEKGSKLSVSDFTASIGAAVKEAVSDQFAKLTTALDGLTASMAEKKDEGDVKKGFRKTLSASEVQVLSKYGGLEEQAEPSIANYTAAIEMVDGDARLDKASKLAALQVLGAGRRRIARAQAQGGVQ